MTKFYEMKPEERLIQLKENGQISLEQFNLLSTNVSKQHLSICNDLTENVISGYYLPLSIVTDVHLNDKVINVPMVTEESSVVAAINKIAKLIRDKGSLNANCDRNYGVGQLLINKLTSPERFMANIELYKKTWLEFAHENSLASMHKRGGGIKNIYGRIINGNMGVIYFDIDVCDAMGANIINQTLEHIAPLVAKNINENIDIKILSNLTDKSLTTAKIELNIEKELAQNIVAVSNFAKNDIYRTCTHNKGVMNGIDAILVATGNDWRAVSAGIYTYSAINGNIPLATWEYSNDKLLGKLVAPINVGTCGGIASAHPTAKCCLEILGVRSATELSEVCAAIGLMQNLAALLALSSQGICKGHMSLHIKNLLKAHALSEQESALVLQRLKKLICAGGFINNQTIIKQINAVRHVK